MSTRYLPLPQHAEREIEDAFDLNDEHNDVDNDNETTPLTVVVHLHHPAQQAQSSSSFAHQSIPNQPQSYDFDREYDFPPPGSPPLPSAQARPNDYGNSNGLLPSSPIDRPQRRHPWYRRFLGAVLPSQYQPVATEPLHLSPTGGGNDGVFANVTAKPQPARTVRSDDGQVIVIPEDSQKDVPPVFFFPVCFPKFILLTLSCLQSYQEAQADAVPPYWETTIHAPGLLSEGGIYVEDLPTGSFFMFCATTFISFFFQFIGFFVTYLLHTTHAAKYGSRAGLGLTLIQYGFSSRMANAMTPPEGSGGQGIHGTWEPVVPGEPQDEPPSNIEMTTITSKDWLSILFMTLGIFAIPPSISQHANFFSFL